MKLLNKDSDYAIRALFSLAIKNGSLISSREIAEEQGIPLQYMRRILQVLVKAGFVSSKEGKGGGLSLVIPPGKISVKDIIELFQGEIQVSECLFRQNVCPNFGTCVLRKRINRIEARVSEEFAGISIADLINDMEE